MVVKNNQTTGSTNIVDNGWVSNTCLCAQFRKRNNFINIKSQFTVVMSAVLCMCVHVHMCSVTGPTSHV